MAPGAARRDPHAPVGQDAQRLAVAQVLGAQEVRGRNFRVLKDHLGTQGTLLAHLLVHLTDADARRAARLDQKGAHALRTARRIGHGDHGEQPRDGRVADVVLGAVQDVYVPPFFGAGADVRGVRTAARLRDRKPRHALAGRHARQKAAFLFLAAQLDQPRRADAGMRADDPAKAHVPLPQSLVHRAAAQRAQAHAAVLLRNTQAEQPQVRRLAQQLRRDGVAGLDLVCARLHAAQHEIADGLLHDPQVVR